MQMKSWQQAIKDSVVPGTAAAAAMYAAAAACGRREIGSAMAPVNATSHVVWGEEAAFIQKPMLRYTGVGVAIGTVATMLWAAVFEKVFGQTIERRGIPAALLGGAAAAGTAYVKDYYLFPRRLQPGFEKRLPARSLLYIYGAMGAGLAVGGWAASRAFARSSRRARRPRLLAGVVRGIE